LLPVKCSTVTVIGIRGVAFSPLNLARFPLSAKIVALSLPHIVKFLFEMCNLMKQPALVLFMPQPFRFETPRLRLQLPTITTTTVTTSTITFKSQNLLFKRTDSTSLRLQLVEIILRYLLLFSIRAFQFKQLTLRNPQLLLEAIA
jgi:hypothetical protein